MDFKNYVRMMLEAEKAKDQDEDKVEDQDEEDPEDEEDDEDDEQASVKTKACRNGCEPSVKSTCTGAEPSTETDDEDEDDEDSDEEDNDKDKEDEEIEEGFIDNIQRKKLQDLTDKYLKTHDPKIKAQLEQLKAKMGARNQKVYNGLDKTMASYGYQPKTYASCRTLKESMLHLASDDHGKKVITEEEEVLCEGIKNNSASKYLSKLAKRAEKEAAKYEKKGMKEEAKTSKKAATSLKEASNKLYKCETRYQGGDASAKREYKAICKQYSKELKSLGKTAKGLKGLLITLVSGTLLLGAVGTTIISNENLIDKITYAANEFKSGEEGGVARGLKSLKDIGENDKNWIKSILDGSKFESTNWADKKYDMEAVKDGWDSGEQRRHYTEEGLGGAVKKGKQALKDFGAGFKGTYKGAAEEAGRIVKGAAESARN